ncbi:hypothetical protein Pla100_63340 [Neorhodopirellula pilleata]|uniref:Uncharacterized protein n=2 Tax=Neorhodopirellula pilleata TaxID=2714738 RepID=A0A5C5YQT1_9BACT|nr:hypothetical protein Pla100_63340 [Neorhodopirellula pilleata]
MTQFATTADVRSTGDSTLLSYVRLYTFAFASMIAIDLLLRAFSVGLTGPIGPAVMAAFICTIPKNKPRFRSLSRFAIALVLSGLFAFSTAVLYKSFDIEDASQFAWVSSSVFYTIIFGCIESISFFATCVVTPGRSDSD